MENYPTPWQKKTLWAALSALAVVVIGSIAVGLIWLTSRVLGFLQPILIPFAVAGVMAYLLDPVVSKLVAWGASRKRAVLYVFAVVSIGLAGILLWLVPAVSQQSVQLARKTPKLTEDARQLLEKLARDVQQHYPAFVPKFPGHEGGDAGSADSRSPEPTNTAPAPAGRAEPSVDAAPVADAATKNAAAQASTAEAAESDPLVSIQQFLSGDSLRKALPTVIQKTWNFVRSSVGGFLGVFGFLLSLVIVPIYLYYLLVESRNISESWGDYVPLRASHFKDEVVETLEEINGYLIAFFRGQLLVSLINGAATGMGLVIVGLDFGLLLGLLLCVLGLIPYLGILLCWIPAVLIAALHGDPWFLQGAAWWAFPLIVTGIFVAVQQVDGIFLTPKIVGESVGLHPMTVIASVFVWSLLMGGLLGAILAVPMTATIKVLLKRYIWERRFLNGVDPRLATEESFSVQQAQHSVSERDL
jgi:predicted PurR-regulated permease PerM